MSKKEKKIKFDMNKKYQCGLDIAKDVYQICINDSDHNLIANRALSKNKLIALLLEMPKSEICMEACRSSHFWSRLCKEIGHTPYIIPSQITKAFLCGKSKNDFNDADAIYQAFISPRVRFVAQKSVENQQFDHELSVRKRYTDIITEIINFTRGMLAEHGYEISKGKSHFHRDIAIFLGLDETKEITSDLKFLVENLYDTVLLLEDKVKKQEERIKILTENNPDCSRLESIPGVGPVVASYIAAKFFNISQFPSSRSVAAYLGLTPGEHSSGGKHCQVGITKHGDRTVRSLLILGARAVISGLKRRISKTDGNTYLSKLDQWIIKLLNTKNIYKVTTALANKLARIIWAVLSKKENFDEKKLYKESNKISQNNTCQLCSAN